MVKRTTASHVLAACAWLGICPAAAREADVPAGTSEFAAGLAVFLANVQHPMTGLPASFPDSRQEELRTVAFTYDVAASALALAHYFGPAPARRALGTYLGMALPSAREPSGPVRFNTAYHVATGRPTLEHRLHGGPVFWLAIAMMRVGDQTGDAGMRDRGIRMLEWVRAHFNHFDGGIVMGVAEPWSFVTSVENNWVYYAALRIASGRSSPGPRRTALMRERRAVYAWLTAHAGMRGDGDAVKALDTYTHPLLVGPEAHLEDGAFGHPEELAAWARDWVEELERLFRVPGTSRYDYTDAREARQLGRARAGWLEGTEQVAVAYQTWAPWFERLGDRQTAARVREAAEAARRDVRAFARTWRGEGVAVPNTDSPEVFQTFMDGWSARPKDEAALNGTNWAYFAEAAYNPFTMALPRRADAQPMLTEDALRARPAGVGAAAN
ncbi:MAG TPA: hypothetical protein VGB20_06465 [bacterium]